MINDIAKKLDFPNEAIECFEDCLDKILENKEASLLISDAMDEVFTNEDDVAYYPYIQKVSELTDIHRHTVNMVFWLLCAKPLKYIYKINNISDEVYYDTISDLKPKLDECYRTFGIWGTFTNWFTKFFKLQRFGFGRLEYDNEIWNRGDYKSFVKDGDFAVRIHIPSGSPLTEEAVMDSFKKVYNFHKDKTRNGILPILCVTWFFYPPIVALFKETSNLKKFADLFDMIDSQETPGIYSALRFAFDTFYESPETLKNLPENSDLQRKLKKYLLDGNSYGTGSGIVLFDGEKIINK